MATSVFGDSIALACALSWAIAVLLYRRVGKVDAASLNLFKNAVATVLLALTMWAIGLPMAPDRSAWDWWMLSLSGVVGLALADTLFFAGLQRIDASAVAVADCTYAPSVLLLSLIFLGETARIGFYLGAPLVMLGVWIVSSEPSDHKTGRAALDKVGLILAIVGVQLTAAAVIIAKPVLENAHVVEATFVRLLAGTAALAAYQWLTRRTAATVNIMRGPSFLLRAVPASVMGAYVTMLLWIGGMKYGSASRAAVLNQMAVVFVIVLSRLSGERVSPRRWIGAGVAVVGAVVVLVQ